MKIQSFRISVLICFMILYAMNLSLYADKMEFIKVNESGLFFIREKSGEKFSPFGFNYDRDTSMTLIEDYWDTDRERVESDFDEMKKLGANCVRVHIQFAKFVPSPDQINAKNFAKLKDLIAYAENIGIYIDLTGLGCYHKNDVPEWYDKLNEDGRWRAQAFFWEKIAEACADSPALFCYNLMNEPVVPGAKVKSGDWLLPPFAGKCYVQYITLDPAGRERTVISEKWMEMLTDAIRKKDRRHLITVGLLPTSLKDNKMCPGFTPESASKYLDFIVVHFYPERGKVLDSLRELEKFQVGKPVVVEEMFPLNCSMEELSEFVDTAEKAGIAGFFGFYWGKTIEEMTPPKDIGEAITKQWLEYFREKRIEIKK